MFCLLIGKVDLGFILFFFVVQGGLVLHQIFPTVEASNFIDMFRICDELEKGTGGGEGVSFCVICLRAQC